MNGAHAPEVKSSHYQVTCSTSADTPSATQSPGDQIQSSIPAGRLPQVASLNGAPVAAALPRTIPADGDPAPFRDFDARLDDLQDANGLFNEDLRGSHLPDG